MSEFKIKILGSNAASFAHGRHHTSQALYFGADLYLIDCGEGTQIRMQQHQVKPGKLSHIFISHLHGDHCLGLPGLLSSLHLSGRLADMHIYGPPGLDEWLTTYWRVSNSVLSYKVHFHRIVNEPLATVFENDDLIVRALPLDHRIQTTGFLFQEKIKFYPLLREKLPADILPHQINQLVKGQNVLDEHGAIKYAFQDFTGEPHKPRTYAYCSDTRYLDHLAELVHGVDLLYHEATFVADREERALTTFHSTALQAAMVAKAAKAKELIIGHFSSRYETLDAHLQEAKTVFEHTKLAIEGEVFTILKQQR